MEKNDKALTIKQQVYQIIKTDIHNGVYKPGQQINEYELSVRLGISRSPIRESLRQLVSDGLTVEYPNRGVFVREFTLEEMNNIYDYRVLIENYAIKNCAQNLSDRVFEILTKCKENLLMFYENKDMDSYIEEDTFLHQTIVDLCGNPIIIDSYDRVSFMNMQFRSYSLTGKQRFDESIHEHIGIIDNIIAGNYEKAAEINSTHLTRAKETLLRAVSKQLNKK